MARFNLLQEAAEDNEECEITFYCKKQPKNNFEYWNVILKINYEKFHL